MKQILKRPAVFYFRLRENLKPVFQTSFSKTLGGTPRFLKIPQIFKIKVTLMQVHTLKCSSNQSFEQFLIFKHQISTRICSEAKLFETLLKKLSSLIVFWLLFSETNLQSCFKHASEQTLVKVCCLKYQKLIKYMIRSRIQGMYWCAHKTATLTSFQHTVGGGALLSALI